jgi:hypothetical protein
MPDTTAFTFKEMDRGVRSTLEYMVIRTPEGYHITGNSTNDKERAVQELFCDSTYATLQWHYTTDLHTDISFQRKGNSIELTGLLRGTQVKKKLKIDSRPWYQIVPLGLQTLSQDSSGRSKFWAVSLKEPAVLKAVCFYVADVTYAPLPGHPEIACRCFHLKIQGVPSAFWVGDYFLRKADNVFIYYEGHSFTSKKPVGTIDVINHR